MQKSFLNSENYLYTPNGQKIILNNQQIKAISHIKNSLRVKILIFYSQDMQVQVRLLLLRRSWMSILREQ